MKIYKYIILIIIILGSIIYVQFNYADAIEVDIPLSDFNSLRTERLRSIVLSHIESAKSGQVAMSSREDIGISNNHQLTDQFEERFLVKFSSTASLDKIRDMMKEYTYKIIGDESRRQYLVLSSDMTTLREKAGSDLLCVESDQVCLSDRVPNDSLFSDQWAMETMNLPGAWDIVTGNDDAVVPTIMVAIIDSGVKADHPDLINSDIRLGWDYINWDHCYWDSNGHGTSVTGVIAAGTNNTEGIAGVCWNIAIVPLLISDSEGSSYVSTLIEAIYDATDVGCKVINISMGHSGFIQAEYDAIQYAVSRGCIVVASAGNDSNDSFAYPASYDPVISVGSIDKNLIRSDFSNYNDRLDVCAPGEKILTTGNPLYYPYSNYIWADGTSYSAPYVSGVAALACCINADLSSIEFTTLLRDTSFDLGSTGYDSLYGFGVVNADLLVSSLSQKYIVTYQSHVQDIGWQEWKGNNETSGTSGQSKRLEAIRIELFGVNGGIEYRTHVQDIGWMGWVSDGTLSGTIEQSKRLEAIQIRLTGSAIDQYDIYYRVHAQEFGWLDWAKNGDPAGTAGFGYRLEAIEIRLIPKGEVAPGPITRSFIDLYAPKPTIRYQCHVQDIGWQDWSQDGAMAGTSGQSKRLEAIRIQIDGISGIEYRTHVQDLGWMSWVSDGSLSGTSGQSKRLEAISIRLAGDMAMKYDIYYRVHAQNFGWLDWARNGQSAGTVGFGYRLEGIEIRLVIRGYPAPGNSITSYIQK